MSIRFGRRILQSYHIISSFHLIISRSGVRNVANPKTETLRTKQARSNGGQQYLGTSRSPPL
jgi:hypothetical protein